MKQSIRLLLFLLTSLVVYNCNGGGGDVTKNIVVKWKIAQQLADPGDGSGRFRDAYSNKTITFLNDNTFTSNGDLCFITSSTENSSSGT
jgi:hypothetical protein